MDTIFDKIKASNHLPQLPQVMLKLIRACGSDNTDIDELTRIVSTDPALTSKLLQIIASPYVNLPKQVNTIKTAVVYLGLDTIRNIAISSSAMHFFKMAKSLEDFDITGFWYHSYKCGVLARRLAEEEGQTSPDAFFLAGLLHDIGSLVLMKTFPKAYRGVLAAVKKGKPLAEAEAEAFGADTPQVSAWLFTHWHLNPITSDAVLFMNEPLERIQGELGHVRILYAANLLASDLDHAAKEALSLLEIPEMRLGQIEAEAEDEVDKMARNLGVARPCEKRTDREIAVEIKDLSLFFGTLETLSAATDIPGALHAVQTGMEILFHIPRIFFFLFEKERNILAGTCDAKDHHHHIVKSIAIPLDSQASLVAASARNQEVKNSFLSKKLAVSDAQIIRLMASKGLFCIPITARGQSMGVMALGVDRDAARRLSRNKGLLRLFSSQTGLCLENLNFHQTYARDLNEKKMEAYAALTDKVIHEVNNPIAIIKNYLETLGLKLPDKHPAQEELSLVGEEMSRVSSLLDGLSSFSRPRIGGLEMIDINQTCTRVMEVLKKSILLPRQIRASIETDDEIPALKMDGNGLKQILINLIKNAAEAMDKGGKIVVKTALLPGSAKVMIDEKKKIPGWVEVRIQDNGPGIAPAIKERLFEPYNTSKSGSGNSGLGLAIVHAIVREMKGRITCDSQEGAGTCFTLFLPMAPEQKKGAGHDAA